MPPHGILKVAEIKTPQLSGHKAESKMLRLVSSQLLTSVF
jgi:hypothetical protein